MHVDEIRLYALSLPQTSEGFPFNQDTLVFKVFDKMFLLLGLESQPLRMNFKARPEDNIRYREDYPSVLPGYHSNKRHWSTVIIDGSVSEVQLRKWILDSFWLASANLPKYQQKQLRD